MTLPSQISLDDLYKCFKIKEEELNAKEEELNAREAEEDKKEKEEENEEEKNEDEDKEKEDKEKVKEEVKIEWGLSVPTPDTSYYDEPDEKEENVNELSQITNSSSHFVGDLEFNEDKNDEKHTDDYDEKHTDDYIGIENKRKVKKITNEFEGGYEKICNFNSTCHNWYCKFTHTQRKICQCQTLICTCGGVRQSCDSGVKCSNKNTTCQKYHRGHRNINCYRDIECNSFHCNFKHSNDETRCCHLNYWDCVVECTKIHKPCPDRIACQDKTCKLKHPRD